MMMVESKAPGLCTSADRRNGFYKKYLETCKAKNIMPLAEIKGKAKNTYTVDFHADRVVAQDWLAICIALHHDRSIKELAIRFRKSNESCK